MNGTGTLFPGLRILDLTRVLAGPSCTRMFAELGAEVIKIESAPDGDMVRQFSKMRNERSLYFVQQNLGKRSLCVDLRKPQGIELIKALAKRVDVVVENFKPGTLAAMGLGYEVLKELKPDIVLCSISAMGQTGPLAHKPGYDTIAQGYSGVTSVIGEPGRPPSIPRIAAGDVSSGVHGAFAVLAALYNRDRTGKGQHIDIGLLDTYYHYHEINIHQYSGSNGEMKPTRGGRHLGYVCPSGVFNANGGYVIVMAFAHHWKDLCAAMGRPELAKDERLATDAGRLAHLDEVVDTIETWLQTFPDRESAIAKLEEFQVPVAPVLSVEETVSHPHLRARGTVRTINDRIAGEFDIPGNPVRFSDYKPDPQLQAPTLGEHNEQVLSEVLGLDESRIGELRSQGVLFQKYV